MIDGLKYGVAESTVTVATTDTALVPGNPDRVGLILSCPRTNRVTVTMQGAAVLDSGINLYPGGPPFVVCVKYQGQFACRPLRAIAATGAETIGVVEIIANGIGDRVEKGY